MVLQFFAWGAQDSSTSISFWVASWLKTVLKITQILRSRGEHRSKRSHGFKATHHIDVFQDAQGAFTHNVLHNKCLQDTSKRNTLRFDIRISMYTMYGKKRKFALLIPFSKNVELPLSIMASKCCPPPPPPRNNYEIKHCTSSNLYHQASHYIGVACQNKSTCLIRLFSATLGGKPRKYLNSTNSSVASQWDT